MSGDGARHMLRSAARTLLAVGLLLVLGRCDLTESAERQSLVVEAFLSTGRPLPTVTLRQTRPLNEPGDRSANAATGATVDLTIGGQPVSYEERPQRDGQYVPVEDVEVSARMPWQFTIRWQGETAWAHGTTPLPVELRKMCVEVSETPVQAVVVDSLRRDSLDIPAEQSYLYPIDVSLEWRTDRLRAGEDTTHWVRPRLRPDTTESSSRVVNFFLQPVEVRREDQFSSQNGRRAWTGVYAVPVAGSTSALPSHDLTVSLTRGDTAFAAFAGSRNDPERREPISNVEGGLGIATAVALDSLRRTVASAGLEQCYAP
ncbi:MAG: hypothetical protein BRD51_04960 [Bacteroidetes bacterium SW_11_64_17]|nr:MAG: hypothetical protein BRD51_04960 [Bacteroidetes bacterium SW_11_64_17]